MDLIAKTLPIIIHFTLVHFKLARVLIPLSSLKGYKKQIMQCATLWTEQKNNSFGLDYKLVAS